jgi:4-hydroxybenzoate polyprenyltransferase
MAVVYSTLLVIIPLVYLVQKLWKAGSSPEFASLSRLSKLIMFTGILSMIFFRVYF